uniref:Uncharacterized protein n=2 Tax=Caenorhabditis japonica TaxID=281687 RepID=A0A8R1EB41_CAEJA
MSHYPRTMGRRSRHQEIPVERRSQSSQPYHAITESYSKEVTHRPLGSVEDFPPEIVEILKDRPRRSVSPPLIRR